MLTVFFVFPKHEYVDYKLNLITVYFILQIIDYVYINHDFNDRKLKTSVKINRDFGAVLAHSNALIHPKIKSHRCYSSYSSHDSIYFYLDLFLSVIYKFNFPNTCMAITV